MSKAVPETKQKADLGQPEESVLWEWVKTIIYAIILALFIRYFFLQTFKIPTGSMEPTLRGAMNYGHGDKIMVVKFIYGVRIPFTDRKVLAMAEPKRGDVIVFKTKGVAGLDQGKDFIKRVVGLGGETLRIVPDDPYWNVETGNTTGGGGHVYVNGQRLQEPAAIADRTYYPAGAYGEGEIDVPPDHYYMLGDNALNSRDSRFWGFVPRDNVIGKAMAIYWPPSRMGLVR